MLKILCSKQGSTLQMLCEEVLRLYMQKDNRFRWLHLSDIHCMFGADQMNLRNEFINKVATIDSVDCIIVTGDFFNQGKCDGLQLEEFLKKIYGLCAEKGKWEWNEVEKMTRLFFCPGNHDLNRNAMWHSDGEGINSKEFIRKEILSKQINESRDQIIGEPNSYKTLTAESFWKFEQIMSSLVTLPDEKNPYKYECNVFTINNQLPNPVVFVGINTELYAGQIRNEYEIKRDIAECWFRFQTKHIEKEYGLAQNAYREYVEYQEELYGEIAKDDGKLCFISEEAQKYAKKRIDTMIGGSGEPIVILFGHRSLDSLTEGARALEAIFANECYKSNVYLCGHSHHPGHKIVSTSFTNGNPYKQSQMCVGGIFADSLEYNMCSFSVGTITWESNCRSVLREELYIWTKRFSPIEIEGYANKSKDKPYDWSKIEFVEIELKCGGDEELREGRIEERNKQLNNLQREENNIHTDLVMKKPYRSDKTF